MTATMCTDQVTVPCADCGTAICLTRGLLDLRQRDGKPFYCPHGHSNIYPVGPTDDQKRIKQLQADIAQWREDLRHVRDQREQLRVAAANLVAHAQTCPFGCGWQGRRRYSLWGDVDTAGLGRFMDRAGHDLAIHLQDAHHATPSAVAGLLGAGEA